MLISRLVTHQLISSFVVGVGSVIDGSQNAVWPFALEDEFCRIMNFTCLTADNFTHQLAGPRAFEVSMG